MKQSILDNLSDQKLLELSQYYGKQARIWRQKFAGLLPEINRRKLYIKKGCASIFEFAAKLAGMSEEQVRNVLNLDKKFATTPVLHSMLINGTVSVNKLIRITSVVTQANESFWAQQAQQLPQSALETLVRDTKIQENSRTNMKNYQHTGSDNYQGNTENGFQQTFLPGEALRTQRLSTQNTRPGKSATVTNQATTELRLSPQLKQRLLELQQKGIDINQLLEQFLDEREAEIEQEKQAIAEKEAVDSIDQHTTKKPSRYIPIKIKKLLTKEHGTLCSVPTCQKPSQAIHHTQRFSLVPSHDPRYLAPLCNNHHIIAHSIDIKFRAKRTYESMK